MSAPFFSVIIPTLNEARYLPKLLTGLKNQLDKDFETIVVDANSEDQTAATAAKFPNPLSSPRIITSPWRNVSRQRNLGAQKARGKFLVFLDADVVIPANFLSEIHNYLLENRHCSFLTTWMKPDSHYQSDKIIISLVNGLLEVAKSINKPFVAGFDIVIKKSIFRKTHGFDPRLKFGEDHELAQRLQRYGIPLHILKQPQLTMSLRRFRREGTLKSLRQYALVTTKILLEGPITEQLFDYPMGGHHFPPVRSNSQYAKTK